MPSHDTTVQGVQQRVVNKRTGGTTTVYDVIDGNGVKWSTFKQPVANEANRLIGHRVEMQIRIEQNGQYENKFIDDIRAFGMNGGSAQAEQPRGGYSPAERAMSASGVQPDPQPMAVDTPIPMAPQGEDDKTKQIRIMRQAAAKVSAVISTTPIDFWRNLDPLFNYFQTGLMPQDFLADAVTSYAQPEPTQQSEFFPAGTADPGREYSGSPTDDDIPF